MMDALQGIVEKYGVDGKKLQPNSSEPHNKVTILICDNLIIAPDTNVPNRNRIIGH